MASASDPALASAFAPAAAQNPNANQSDAGNVAPQSACGPPPADGGGSANATSNGADLAAAFTSFLANPADTYEPNNLPQAMLSNIQLAGILGLLPHQQQQGPAGDIASQNEVSKGQEPAAPQTHQKDEDGADGTVSTGPVPSADSHPPPPSQHQHQHPHPHLMHVPGMPPQPTRFAAPPGRWPPSAIAAAHWDFAATACGMLSQQQPPGGGPPGPMQAPPSVPASQPPGSYPNSQQGPQGQGPPPQMAAAPGAAPQQQQPSTGPSPAAAPPSSAQPATSSGGPVPGSQLPVQHHLAMPALRGYPYGPYGEPSPYPPHARPPPGPYHHPGMPGPHGHMVPFHPGFPPMHHMPHRGPYYPHDGRFPPMGPMGHPGYPPPGYFRGHPAMPPPHPHPAYHYMPPPYGGHHPAMHPGMYHVPQGMPGGPPGAGQQHDAHQRDGTASAASAGTAVGCGGVGSDGGTDPASAARQAGKVVNGSSGGSESEDVGLEAVITLRPGPPDHHENASGERAAPPDGSEDGLAVAGGNSCTDASGRPMPGPGMAPGGEHLAPDGGPGAMMHKVAPWPHMAPPPPHAVGGPPMPGVGNYEWPPPPPPAAIMPGYPPLHAPGGWPPYPYDPMAAAMHHQHMMMGEVMPGEEDTSGGGGLEMHQMQRRRPSQSSLGGQLSGGGGVPHHHMYAAMRRPPFPQAQHPVYAMPVSGGGKAPFGVDPAMQRPGSAEAPGQGSLQMQRSGSLGQLFAAGDATCNVSRRTQRLKKRRSADSAPGQQPGSTPDPFVAAMAAAERAAMGRDSSTGSGAQVGLPPMFPGSGGARRSSNGSDRTALCRGMMPANNRQRSDPGYLIENGDHGVAWGLGAGVMAGPVAGLGQLVHYPQQLQPPQMQMQALPMQQGRRPSENGLGGGGRVISLPKRFEDAIMTLEYPKGPYPGYGPGMGMPYEMHYDDAGPALEEPVYEEDEEDGHDVDLGDVADDSDEDYEAGAAARRAYRSRQGGLPTTEVITRKRKAPMMREELPQPEKKRKTRDPATISKVVLNCVTILRMVNHDLVYEKEIRNALGNNPDTSKALRLLMNQGKLVRTGQGGRGNPFCYRCTPLGIDTLQRIEDAATPEDDPAAGPNPEQRAAAVAVVKPAEEC